MIRRRAPGEGKVEKVKLVFKGKKFPKGVKIEDLPPAIVDGKWVVPVKGNVAFERLRGGKVGLHVGIVQTLDEEKKTVMIYDETLEQTYSLCYSAQMEYRIASLD